MLLIFEEIILFTHIRKLISKWNGKQDIYIEQMSREGTIQFNKEETMKLYHTETQEEYNALMAYVEKKDMNGIQKKNLQNTIVGTFLRRKL